MTQGTLFGLIVVAMLSDATTHAGDLSVEPLALTLHDPARNRDVPIRAYLPVTTKPAPVVFFSHGMGESRDSYEYIGRALAEGGYVAIHLTHHGSDRDLLQTKGWLAIVRATKDPETWKNRPLDVAYVLDLLEQNDSRVHEIAVRADLERVAVAGHSAGAFTAMAMAGTIIAGRESMLDPRIRAAVAMSLPRLDPVFRDGAYDNIRIPVLHLTGTRDRSLFYWTFPKHRRVAFDKTPGGKQYLVTLKGATHWTFSNLPSRGEAELQQLLGETTRLFLDAYLRDDASALERLHAFDNTSKGAAKLERK